jgi:hypothetical protein
MHGFYGLVALRAIQRLLLKAPLEQFDCASASLPYLSKAHPGYNVLQKRYYGLRAFFR